MPRTCTVFLVLVLAWPTFAVAAPARNPTPIRDAIVQQARQQPLMAIQTAPMRQAPGKPSRLMPILVGAAVGCGIGGLVGLGIGEGGRIAGLGCAGLGTLGALLGFGVGTR